MFRGNPVLQDYSRMLLNHSNYSGTVSTTTDIFTRNPCGGCPFGNISLCRYKESAPIVPSSALKRTTDVFLSTLKNPLNFPSSTIQFTSLKLVKRKKRGVLVISEFPSSTNFVDDYSVCPSPLPLVAPFSFVAFLDFDAFLDFYTAPSQL